MSSKMNKIDWGGLTPTIYQLEVNVDHAGGVGSGTSVTGTELTKLATASRAPVLLGDATTYTVLAANTDLIHVIPDLTTDCTITLPTASAGLHYKFVSGTAAQDTADWIITMSSGYFIGGGIYIDSDAAPTNADVFTVGSDGNSNDFCRVLTPDQGTYVEVWCDGTNWYVDARVVSSTASSLAFADT